ncbi:MAG: enoyl-CoA hydratase/isomerase family protein [Myxococcota bacterium]
MSDLSPVSPVQARALVASLDARESASPITGAGVLALDLTAPGADADPDGWHALAARLMALPCPVLSLSPAGIDPAYGALEVASDVHAASEDELRRLVGRVRSFPLASLALVQLLRQTPFLDVVPGLTAESWVYSMLQTGPEFGRWLEAQRAAGGAGREVEEGPPVALHRRDARLELVLDRPSRHNAYSATMRDALVEGLAVALADPSIEEVVLRGEGASFCSGGDLDEFGTAPDPVTAHAVRSTRHPAHALSQLSGRLRAELKGACIGAGMELPAWAGRVVADESAFFELPELGMGLVPGAGGTVSLPRRIGRERTGWLALSGERIDVATARRWGLVDEVRTVRD